MPADNAFNAFKENEEREMQIDQEYNDANQEYNRHRCDNDDCPVCVRYDQACWAIYNRVGYSAPIIRERSAFEDLKEDEGLIDG